MPGGRPLKFQTVEELEKMIDSYFNGGCRVKKVILKDSVVEMPVPTVTGLALFLGFESRQSFYDYENRTEFSYTIKRARTFIEMEYEEMLRTNPTGAIFALKNFGWKDKFDIDQNIKSADVSESLDVEQKQKIAKLLLNE